MLLRITGSPSESPRVWSGATGSRWSGGRNRKRGAEADPPSGLGAALMKSIIRWSPVVMFLGLGGWFVLPVRDAPEAPRSEKDQFDDPLPPGAIARYGTVRLRDGHGISGLQFLPDGKELLSWSPAGTRVWEATTGKAIRSFAPRRRAGDVEHGRATALSPDARTFVVIYEDPRYSDSDSR